MSTATMREFDALLRDLRHMEARAASDLADWLVYLEVQGKADRSLYAYMRLVARLLVKFPERELRDFTDTDIETFLAGIPRQTRHVPRSIVGQFFKWAKRKHRIDVDPMESVAEIRQPQRRPKDIFSEEEIALLSGLPSPDGQLFALLFGSGLRKGEARNLRREHVDLARTRLVVYHGKGDKDRLVPLTQDAVVAVADLDLLERLERHDHLWYSRPGGGRRMSRRDPIGDTTFCRWYERCLREAGLKRYLNPHQTRHTYGHRMRELGLDLEERQLLMGHESVRTTQRYYGTLTIEDVARKMSELEARD